MRTLFCVFELSALAYILIALLLFGDVFAPIAFVTLFSDHLGAPYWKALILVSGALAATSVYFLPDSSVLTRCRTPVFVSLWMGFSVLSIGIYAEWMRLEAVQKFSPDAYIQHSFFLSIRNAPRDFQFFLHAAALKGCKPYAWSYREMSFYELSPNVAANVLSPEWLDRCAIERTRR